MKVFRRDRSPSPPRTYPDLKTDAARSHLRVEIDGRSARVHGEAFLPDHGSPDFVLSRKQVEWDDGSPVGDDDRELILRTLLESARERGLRIEIE